ncbi:MAG: sodium:calcium antiporter [Ignavibacteriae bacterium]|nr:sodium:calcium antiporter [Ignavibacteriota bacterium]
MEVLESISGFIFCSAAIVYAGIKLSFYGDRIAEQTGLGKAWIGLIMMASITSLPELITGISSVAIVNAPDLAAGDIFGSCVFNLFILSILDVLLKKPITSLVRSTHVFAGACGIILITLSGLAILLSAETPVIGWISLMTPVIFIVYLLSIWLIFKFENRNDQKAKEKELVKTDSAALQKTLMRYAFNAFIVVAAALFLPYFGNILATQSGMGNTFFGTLFLAISTSLPELVVCISAIRIGSVDMAVGNLFGSNIFNIFILGIDDLFYRGGSLFAAIHPENLISILFVIIMTAVAAIGLLFKAERKRFLLAADAFIILLLYAGLMILLFILK